KRGTPRHGAHPDSLAIREAARGGDGGFGRALLGDQSFGRRRDLRAGGDVALRASPAGVHHHPFSPDGEPHRQSPARSSARLPAGGGRQTPVPHLQVPPRSGGYLARSPNGRSARRHAGGASRVGRSQQETAIAAPFP